jgi:hypothetical protein
MIRDIFTKMRIGRWYDIQIYIVVFHCLSERSEMFVVIHITEIYSFPQSPISTPNNPLPNLPPRGKE